MATSEETMPFGNGGGGKYTGATESAFSPAEFTIPFTVAAPRSNPTQDVQAAAFGSGTMFAQTVSSRQDTPAVLEGTALDHDYWMNVTAGRQLFNPMEEFNCSDLNGPAVPRRRGLHASVKSWTTCRWSSLRRVEHNTTRDGRQRQNKIVVRREKSEAVQRTLNVYFPNLGNIGRSPGAPEWSHLARNFLGRRIPSSTAEFNISFIPWQAKHRLLSAQWDLGNEGVFA
ncbi:hypothetical protein K438DRAFT_1757761 [Mycena galopus ATCC 62051]|nr:hypothetical protein K438DRAFT_1757761 [Mycena galopus ATCC 62051]